MRNYNYQCYIFQQVVDALLKKLEVGVIPHYMIPHTLGSLANTNAHGVVPYMKNIFNIILPLLGGLKTELLRQSFSYGKMPTYVL